MNEINKEKDEGLDKEKQTPSIMSMQRQSAGKSSYEATCVYTDLGAISN
jgi:hypothetical protein